MIRNYLCHYCMEVNLYTIYTSELCHKMEAERAASNCDHKQIIFGWDIDINFISCSRVQLSRE